ncbi:homoserine kinase [Terribacillus saccharophilus]|uniref:homoserine kinase n=1 Tax=Terribacillus saccharophilus TaxID=361277 RepID=UPI002DC71B3B|nr:homoserine kinase [Terribacillus saccharophilus]
MKRWQISVPASTANIGPGFDSVGIALDLYLELEVQAGPEWEFIPMSDAVQGLPAGKDNMIYETALYVADRYGYSDLPACTVRMNSDIPLARGLGSSATALVAGIELADCLLSLQLSDEEKLDIAVSLEGHPDNAAPSILGGCVIGYYDDKVHYIQTPIKDVRFLAVIPSFKLATSDARAVLPDQLLYKDAVKASGIANVAVAALLQQNWKLLGEMMTKDLFHQPYRQSMIPHYEEVAASLQKAAYGVYLSGAGPTMIALIDEARADAIHAYYQNMYPDFEWLLLSCAAKGSCAEELAVEA